MIVLKAEIAVDVAARVLIGAIRPEPRCSPVAIKAKLSWSQMTASSKTACFCSSSVVGSGGGGVSISMSLISLPPCAARSAA